LLCCLLPAACSSLSDVDRKVERTVAERSRALGPQVPAPQRDLGDPDAASAPGQRDPEPATLNPAASELTFDAAAESRDVQQRLESLIDQSLLGPESAAGEAEQREPLAITLTDAFRLAQRSARD